MVTEDDYKINNLNSENRRLSSLNSNLKIALIAVSVIIIGVVIAFILVQNRSKKEIGFLNNEKENLTTLVHYRDSVINDYLGTLNEIEGNIKQIAKNENVLNIDANTEMTGSKKEQLVNGIKTLDFLIQKNKKLIADLNSKLYKSGLRITQFENRLTQLQSEIEERDKAMAELRNNLSTRETMISQLNQKVDTMSKDLNEQKNQLSTQDQELNTGYIVLGTSKQLKNKGVIAAEGGILGLGSTELLQTNLPENVFEAVDIRQVTSINVDAKKAEFITSHPKNSYMMVKKNNKVQTVEITDPTRFWKYSRYAVLETK
jgi:archaellum component FlaC